ncbi:ABC transporter ATP-binding protein [Actinokineospora terrae]|uniref:ABC-type quaternary amine transporter n=1 Tax=Actinokineospora terrae TaxID=155974 RepID=A0A1H9XE89_9PSEU|nr:ABC transporter ATP-binding protein [Actinokineospora terrae]SES44528.1 thiamine transport system ATP-binding protein [Actinokineospora terrae]
MLRVDGLTVRYGRVVAVSAVDVEIADGEVLALLGPSGCGKSTLLRAVAGLEPTDGGISWDGADLGGVPVHRRGFGLVFQDGQLFPHRTVAGNVAFGLRMAGERKVAARVDELLDLVGLTGFGPRRVTELSGGEQQRVALARALAPRPRLLLLDEPLSALDRSLREQLAIDLSRLLRDSGTTALVVTHDHDEAFTLANRVAVMRAGRIVQTGTPNQVWRHPVDEDTARFLGCTAFVDATATNGIIDTPFGPTPFPLPNGPVRLGLRPTALNAAPGPTTGTITTTVHRRDHIRLTVQTPTLLVDAIASIATTPTPTPHTQTPLSLNPDGLAIIG